MRLTSEAIADAAELAGIAGRPIDVYAALSSFGHVEGGAQAVVGSLLLAGAPTAVRVGSCSEGLENLASVLALLEHCAIVGGRYLADLPHQGGSHHGGRGDAVRPRYHPLRSLV